MWKISMYCYEVGRKKDKYFCVRNGENANYIYIFSHVKMKHRRSKPKSNKNNYLQAGQGNSDRSKTSQTTYISCNIVLTLSLF